MIWPAVLADTTPLVLLKKKKWSPPLISRRPLMESDGGEHKTWELNALQPLDGEWLSAALVLPECGGRRAAPVIDCFMSHQVRIGARGGRGWADLHLLCSAQRSQLVSFCPHVERTQDSPV